MEGSSMKRRRTQAKRFSGGKLLSLLLGLVLVVSFTPVSFTGVFADELPGDEIGVAADDPQGDDLLGEDPLGEDQDPFADEPYVDDVILLDDDPVGGLLNPLADDSVGDDSIVYADEPQGDDEESLIGEAAFMEASEANPLNDGEAIEPLAAANIRLTGTQRYDDAYKILDMVNAERKKVGKDPLFMDATLMGYAMQRAAESTVYFSHTRPNGTAWYTLLGTSTYSLYTAGENIAIGQTSVSSVMSGWMASPGHRDNILDGVFRSVGIGVFEHGGKICWTQFFSNYPTATNAPKPANGSFTKTISLDSNTCKFTMYSLKVADSLAVGATKNAKVQIANPEASFIIITPDSDYGITWTSSQTTILTTLPAPNRGQIKGVSPGKSVLIAEISGFLSLSKAITVFGPKPSGKLSVSYTTHVQSKGWQSVKKDGAMAGTSGKGLRLEALKLSLVNTTGIAGGLQYRTHIQSIGWQDPVSLNTKGTSSTAVNGKLSGTTGRGLRLEAMTIKLTGDLAKTYDVYYRVHAQKVGWMSWAKNGEKAGTAGYGLRLEALQICLVYKGDAAPGRDFKNIKAKSGQPRLIDSSAVKSGLAYTATVHIQSIGDKKYSANGKTKLGYAGKGLRMESIKLKLKNPPYPGGIGYQTHVQSIGWQAPKFDGERAGTTGKGLRVEAVAMDLTGEMSKNYDIYYRAYVQKFGWSGWAKNSQYCGATGYGCRMEALQIVILPKGVAPGINDYFFAKR